MSDKPLRNKTKKNKKSVLALVIAKLKDTSPSKGEYTQSIGRRKTAIARVRLFPAKKTEYSINGKTLDEYFQTERLARIASAANESEEQKEHYFISVLVKGSGPNAQAEAVRHGVTRALVARDETLRGGLKKLGFLKRDPRSVERKKPGLVKARKAPTWVKR